MKKLIFILLIFMYCFSFSQVYIKKSKPTEKVSMYKEEKVIDITKEPFDIIPDKTGFEKRLKAKNLDNIYKIEIPIPVDGEKFTKDLIENLEVEHVFGSVEFSEIRYVPNDTYYSTQWAFSNTGQAGGTLGLDMDMELAWEMEKGDTNVIVGVAESGFSITHTDLIGNIHYLEGYNFAEWDWTVLPNDHPTAVAGMISAETNNSTGVAGVAGGSGNNDGVRLLSLGIDGGGIIGHMAGFIWAAEMGVSIINCSYGVIFNIANDSTYYKNSLQYFIDYGGGIGCSGGIIVAGGGNDNEDTLIFPARYEPVISVGALSNQDVKMWYSNYYSGMDISAAGGDLNSASGVRSTYYNEETETNEYIYYAGTSIATPLVSGTAALLISYTYGQFTNDEIIYCLLNGADDVDPFNPSYAGKLGSGRVNAYQSLLLADSILRIKNRPQMIFQF